MECGSRSGSQSLLFTLLDTFFAALNYNEAGFFVNRLVRWEWVGIRAITRQVSRRWRPTVLRQVTGILIVTTLVCWVAGLVLGFAFIYLGMIGMGLFQISEGVTPDFVGALYLSVGQFSTVSADNISPGGGWINLIPVLEALLSIMMLSFFIAFVSNLYSVIQNLRSLCADFFQVGPGIGDPVEALQPFFPDGQSRGIDLHLTLMVNDFNLYCDSLRQDRSAYHFQSGEDQFSLPFALHMTSGVIGGLQWGLPSGHEASKSPAIVRLIEAFNGFRDRRYGLMNWRNPVALTPLSRERFEAEWDAFRAHRIDSSLDPWALSFFTLNDAMSKMAHATAPSETDDPYERYVGWLAFAAPAQQFVADVSRDLDYQPIYRGAPPLDLAPLRMQSDAAAGALSVGVTAAGPVARRHGLGGWLHRRSVLLDPDGTRLSAALRTLIIVAVAVSVSIAGAFTLSLVPATAGAFAGVVALFATSSSASNPARRWGLVGLIPVALGITAGILLPREPIWTIVGLAIVAAISVWLGRFGALVDSFGRLLFTTFFFSLLLTASPSVFITAVGASVVAVVCSWIANFVPRRSAPARLERGLRAFSERASSLLDAMIDALATGSDRGLESRVRTESRLFQNTAAYLMAFLDPDLPPAGWSGDRAKRWRLGILDVELAFEALRRSLPAASDYAATVGVRAVLSGGAVELQQHLHALMSGRAPSEGDLRADSTLAGTEHVRGTLAAIHDVAVAIDALYAIPRDGDTVAVTNGALAEHPTAQARQWAGNGELAATDRLAVQSGITVGLSIFLGGLVSVGAEYWAALPAYRGLAPADGSSWTRTLARAVGSVAGATAAFGLALATDHNPVVAFTVLAISVFLTSFLYSIASSWTAFWQTVVLATVYDTLSALHPESIGVRILETIIGAVVAVVVAAVVLPTRTRTRILNEMTAAVTVAMTASHAAFQRLAAPAPDGESNAVESESDTVRAMRAIQTRVRPLRDGPGALQGGGVEGQMTSLWALLYYTQQLGVGAARDAPTITPAQWQKIDAASRESFAAALTALEGRLPARIPDVRDITIEARQGATSAEIELLLDVERVNEALIEFIDDINPGAASVGAATH